MFTFQNICADTDVRGDLLSNEIGTGMKMIFIEQLVSIFAQCRPANGKLRPLKETITYSVTLIRSMD
jgi:hypothetical protein